jgi:hypothetical protein
MAVQNINVTAAGSVTIDRPNTLNETDSTQDMNLPPLEAIPDILQHHHHQQQQTTVAPKPSTLQQTEQQVPQQQKDQATAGLPDLSEPGISLAEQLARWKQHAAAKPWMKTPSIEARQIEQEAKQAKQSSKREVGKGGGFKDVPSGFWKCLAIHCADAPTLNPMSADKCKKCFSMKRLQA